MPEPNFINYAISAIAGAFGVGVTWGTMMIKFRQQESRITKVEDRQARLLKWNQTRAVIKLESQTKCWIED